MSCEVCGKTEDLKTCAKCLRVNYCCREHQIAHWQIHREWCILNDSSSSIIMNNNSIQDQNLMNGVRNQYYEDSNQQNNYIDDYSQGLNSFTNQTIEQINRLENHDPDTIQSCDSIPETVNQFNQGFNNNSYQIQNQIYEDHSQDGQMSMIVGSPSVQESSYSMSAQFNSQRDFILKNLNRYCQMILNDMNQYGFCVIDDFLQNGNQILGEVLNLYQNGRFRNGQVVNSKGTPDAKLIRGDQIAWVEYSEPMCNNVGFLIRILDSIVTRCNATLSGEFANYNISRRTKAMIACYPGNYSKYVRHIDNPNNDGRCITSIYYLNKDYNREKDGGVLRLFPQMNNSIVADVEPKFNRVIFFWSDRRNPHEVMPSARMRFAITVWYFDENERAKAVEKLKQTYPQYPNDKVLVPF